MLIPYELEKKIIAAITAAVSSSSGDANRQCQISGAWQESTAIPRWIAVEPPSPALIHVSVGTGLPRTYTAGDVDFPMNVTLFVRTDLDTSGTLLLSCAEVLENLFRSWQAETYQQAFTALNVPNGFAVGDVAGTQSSGPALNNGICSVTWPLTIGGSYLEPSQPENNNT